MFEMVYFLKQEAPSRRSENRKNHKSRKVRSKKFLAKQKLLSIFKCTTIVAKQNSRIVFF